MFSFFKKAENGEESGKSGKLWILLIAATLGVALLLFGGTNSKKEEEQTEATYSPTEDELALYQSYLEERVKNLCESVEGVSNVTAIVTLSGGFEDIYATELIDGNEEYVVIGSGSSAQALFLSRAAPDIAGIGVVCHGGTDATVKQELLSLLSATFHIPTNRIYITGS